MGHYLIVIIIQINSFFAYAGGGGIETVGGGNGVLIQNEVQLLDLVEAGFSSRQVDPNVIEKYFHQYNDIQYSLSHLELKNKVSLSILSYYIHQIWKSDPFLGQGLVKTIQLYNWFFIDQELKFFTPETVIKNELVQLAIRKGVAVYIDERLFNRMDPYQKVGLILHEAFAALGGSQLPESRNRQIVGALFQNHLNHPEPTKFNHLFGDYFISENLIRKKIESLYDMSEFMHVSYPLSLTRWLAMPNANDSAVFFPVVSLQNTNAGSNRSKFLILNPLQSDFDKFCHANKNHVFHTKIITHEVIFYIPMDTPLHHPIVNWSVVESDFFKNDFNLDCQNSESINNFKGHLKYYVEFLDKE